MTAPLSQAPRPAFIVRTALLLTALAGTITIAAQGRQLQLVSTAWAPFTNPAGQPRFALDLVEAALSRAGVSINTSFVAPADYTRALLAGPYDGSAAAWKDPERDRLLLFSEPYLENRLTLVGRRGGDVSASTLSALRGRRVAIVEGYSYGDEIGPAGLTLVPARSEEDSVRLLLANEVDYVLMDELVVQYLANNYADEAGTRLQFGTSALITRPLHFAVRRELPDAASIVNRFNAQLTRMIADRTYHQLLHVKWIAADIDGDGVVENVPASDRVGTAPPARSYTISTSTKPLAGRTSQRVMVGGNIYSTWASVPDRYKETDVNDQDPRRATASLFTFRW